MKIKSLFIAALVVINSVVAFAGKDEPRKTGFAVVPVKNTEVFKVIYKGENSGKVKLNIYNASGAVIMSETITGTDGFICPVNFAGLTYGEYTIEIVDATGKKIEKVSYQPSKTRTQVHISKLTNEQGKFIVAIANSGAERINVRIYDNRNSLLHTEIKEITGDFAQVYKLTDPSSSYTFEVTDKNGNTKTVTF